ncbi:unnamed protein product [Trichogramma brassicae]|uniref:Cationic amino acid transporter C-terminal domain-containing protein n=1 Tax=Trichogramma brassicae TaxID=86971 RepID=A0A6H5J1X8_9HYME|nr:unnamed protein product [Trichogramma brassicae]
MTSLQLLFIGRPPDFVAFVITLLMMTLMAAGARKSLLFNNVLNAVNLSVWVFIMAAGLFYVDSANWSEHKGFLPYGWSGVFTGAATCFYAFIGFDIIATTGEEATNPKRSIPLAIVSSLVIILIAYVTSSMILTLIVPYDEVDQDSALVEMFGQVGAYKCKYIVAVGALAGLTVSMFGSMFPMPRIVYAMASDGLIFRQLSQVWPMTGTPVLATLASGLAAAFAALIVRLEVLVEMMSIGTLLAYTLVSTCVLILRYQPHTTNLMELLPQSLRTPCRSPEPGQQPQQQQQPAASKESRPDQLGFPGAGSSSLGLGSAGGFAKFLMFVFFFAIFGVLLLISRQPQNRHSLMFKTPALPFVPAIAVTVNIYLIFKLSILTLVRFTLWMTIGNSFMILFF